ncbi:MAG: hypothetical protein AB7S26_33215 [Sandaracinaceae bacterium]
MTVELWLVAGLLGLVALAVAGKGVQSIRWARADAERWRTAGIDGTAVVSDLEAVSPPVGEPVTEWFLTLDVSLSDGERFALRQYWSSVGAREPRVGDRLTVRAHPDRRRDLELTRVPFDR